MQQSWRMMRSNSLPELGKPVYLLIEEKRTPEVQQATLERHPTHPRQYQWRLTKAKKTQVHNPMAIKAWRYLK